MHGLLLGIQDDDAVAVGALGDIARVAQRVHGGGLQRRAAHRGDVALDALDGQAAKARETALVHRAGLLRQAPQEMFAATRELIDGGLQTGCLLAGGRVSSMMDASKRCVPGELVLAGAASRLLKGGRSVERDLVQALGEQRELLLQIADGAIVACVDRALLGGGDGLVAGALRLVEVVDGDLGVLAIGEQASRLGLELGVGGALLGELGDERQVA